MIKFISEHSGMLFAKDFRTFVHIDSGIGYCNDRSGSFRHFII